MTPPRAKPVQRMFSSQEEELMRRAHRGGMHMRQLCAELRAGSGTIYRHMAALGLGYRKPDCRTRPGPRARDFLKLVRRPHV